MNRFSHHSDPFFFKPSTICQELERIVQSKPASASSFTLCMLFIKVLPWKAAEGIADGISEGLGERSCGGCTVVRVSAKM